MLSVRELLEKSWLIYKNHFGLLFGYAAWILLPYAAFVLLSLIPPTSTVGLLHFLVLVTQIVVGLWMFISLLLINQHLLKTPKKKIPDLLAKTAFLLVPSLVLVALIESIIVLGGFVLLIIPGLILWVWFSFAQLSVVYDEQKGMKALVFSRELVRNRFLQTTWRLVAGPALILVTYVITGSLLIYVLASIGGSGSEIFLMTTPPLWVDVIFSVLEVIILPLFLLYFTLLYNDVKKASLEEKPKST